MIRVGWWIGVSIALAAAPAIAWAQLPEPAGEPPPEVVVEPGTNDVKDTSVRTGERIRLSPPPTHTPPSSGSNGAVSDFFGTDKPGMQPRQYDTGIYPY